MPTTRHHINRERRRQERDSRPRASGADPAAPTAHDAADGTDRRAAGSSAGDEHERRHERAGGSGRRPRAGVLAPALCLLTLALGGFAGWAHARAEGLRDDPALHNTALTDLARTSEIKGRTDEAVAALFSYDHTDPGALERAAEDLLTGKAVDQHRTLLADVRERAGERKAVITTTVTESAVERIDGDRARVLVYADQSSAGTAGEREAGEGTYAGAMFAVDVVHRDGQWLVSGIDTFGR
ncbi:membrane protein [Streptomyces ruber]|uniref:Membrane protein n=2 Tax=Streptomyces TaxID=1883 RepID=A0A918EW45_9ACTN|nr:hypothetical protein [Streptomyces ruber]GGQ76489.1 membrane protein [Streptomyces ruber]